MNVFLCFVYIIVFLFVLPFSVINNNNNNDFQLVVKSNYLHKYIEHFRDMLIQEL